MVRFPLCGSQLDRDFWRQRNPYSGSRLFGSGTKRGVGGRRRRPPMSGLSGRQCDRRNLAEIYAPRVGGVAIVIGRPDVEHALLLAAIEGDRRRFAIVEDV